MSWGQNRYAKCANYNHSHEELYDLFFLLDQLLSSMISQNLIFLLATGDSTVRNTYWWKNDWVTREAPRLNLLDVLTG